MSNTLNNYMNVEEDPVLDALNKNYALQTASLDKKYTAAQAELEASRLRGKKEASVNNTKLMKYLPSILKRQGLSGLGVSQTATISANNNYRKSLTDIEADHSKSSAELLGNYADAKLAYDTQFNTQKAQLEQAAIDKAETEAKDKNNEIAGNLEAMISGSAAKSMDELISELGIVLSEGENFNTYVDSLGLEPHVASYLKSQAAQKVSANNTAAGDKTKLEQEQLFKDNYKMAYDAIVNDSITTDFSEYLGQFVAGENISESQLSNLKILAASQVAENKKSVDDKTKLEQEQFFGDNYKMAYNAIVNDSITTDFSEYLSQFVAGENISESQLSNLKMLAVSQAEENERANNSEVKDSALLEISALYLEKKYKEASEILEANKAIIGEGMYSYYKSIIDPKLEQGGEKDDNNPYDDMSEDEIKTEVLSGRKYVSFEGNDYRIKTDNKGNPKQLGSEANEIENNNDFKKQLSDRFQTNNPYDLEKIPDGTTLTIRCDATGANEVNWKDFLFSITDWQAFVPGYNIYTQLSRWFNWETRTITFYDGQWYYSEDKGETK